MTNQIGERRYEQVYGDTFALYSREEMLEFIDPFRIRFDKNGLDARELFTGKRCLDAACGNGRGALFMLMNGAAHVTACDFSEKNVASTRSFLKQFGFGSAEVTQLSLEQLPFGDETFDFVWCNGVLMHTGHPNRCLQQIARVLRHGGKSWIYVYGSGGVYWRTIWRFREQLAHVSIPDCMAALQLLRYETRYVAEFIDDWFATHLRSYTHADFGAALTANGFASVQPLRFGTTYDTSERRNVFPAPEAELMGEGDLRYLLHKTGATPEIVGQQLDEGEYGSQIQWPATVAKTVDSAMERLFAACPHAWQKIAAAAHVQRELRLQMTEPVAFDLHRYVAMVDRVAALAAQVGKL